MMYHQYTTRVEMVCTRLGPSQSFIEEPSASLNMSHNVHRTLKYTLTIVNTTSPFQQIPVVDFARESRNITKSFLASPRWSAIHHGLPVNSSDSDPSAIIRSIDSYCRQEGIYLSSN